MLNGGSHRHRRSHCPECGHGLLPTPGAPQVVLPVDVKDIPLHIEEHQGLPAWCPHCHKVHYAPLPAVIAQGGLIGPRLTAVLAFLKGGCHASYSTIRKFLRDVVRVTISRGQLCAIVAKVSAALEQPSAELRHRLRQEAFLPVDETGHKDCRRRRSRRRWPGRGGTCWPRRRRPCRPASTAATWRRGWRGTGRVTSVS
jgi:transposase